MTDQVERVARAMFSVKYKDLPWPKHPGNAELADLYLQQARAAIAAMQQWQPISTAPRDGTNILTFSLNYCSVRYWGEGEDGDDAWQPRIRGVFPTHWMPLSELPEN